MNTVDRIKSITKKVADAERQRAVLHDRRQRLLDDMRKDLGVEDVKDLAGMMDEVEARMNAKKAELDKKLESLERTVGDYDE